MAKVNIDELFDNAAKMVGPMVDDFRNDGHTAEVRGFMDFALDMTRSMIEVEPGIKLAAKARVAGQKASERYLWSIGPVDAVKSAAAERAERQTELDRLAAAYAADPAFEVECDTMTLAIGLAEAYRHHTGETPTFLLDDDGGL